MSFLPCIVPCICLSVCFLLPDERSGPFDISHLILLLNVNCYTIFAGLPEEKAIVKAAIDRGHVTIALSVVQQRTKMR